MAPTTAPSAHADLEIVRVKTAEWDEFVSVTADGFEMPLPMVEQVYRTTLLGDPGVRAFLGRVEGRAASTAVSVRTERTIGIYSVCTAPSFRGRGIGTAMTWHLMSDADPGWTVAVLQASAMGRPIYERMGFRLVREFTEYTDSEA